jgi:hypothetical protein
MKHLQSVRRFAYDSSLFSQSLRKSSPKKERISSNSKNSLSPNLSRQQQLITLNEKLTMPTITMKKVTIQENKYLSRKQPRAKEIISSELPVLNSGENGKSILLQSQNAQSNRYKGHFRSKSDFPVDFVKKDGLFFVNNVSKINVGKNDRYRKLLLRSVKRSQLKVIIDENFNRNI